MIFFLFLLWFFGYFDSLGLALGDTVIFGNGKYIHLDHPVFFDLCLNVDGKKFLFLGLYLVTRDGEFEKATTPFPSNVNARYEDALHSQSWPYLADTHVTLSRGQLVLEEQKRIGRSIQTIKSYFTSWPVEKGN